MAALLVILGFAVFWNAADHPFLLDSGHTVADNPAVRRLGNIPRFFRDPSTFSVLRSNVIYRPVLQTSYALNYAASGYAMPGWHATQILIHALNAFLLFLIGERVRGLLAPGRREAYRYGPALAALAFLVHPTSSGVVCYIAGRSTLLSGCFLLLALRAYMTPASDPAYLRPGWASAAWVGLAMLTKVETIAAPAMFFLWDAWQQSEPEGDRPRPGFFASLRRAAGPVTFRRIAPTLAVIAACWGLRMVMMSPFDYSAARGPLGVGRYEYLVTQLTAWWRYVGLWFAPVGLVADHAAFPVRRGLGDPLAALCLTGWLVVAGVLVGRWRRAPEAVFLAVSALALLSPTSSVVPLAEMVNELRPYLPVAILSLVWMMPLSRALGRALGGRGMAALVAAWLLCLGGLARRRNEVFTSATRYWQDVVDKAPSARGHNNLGLAQKNAGRTEEAYANFRRAVELAPSWYVARINLALELERRGDAAGALAELDHAVRVDPFSYTARVWRGEYHLRHGRRDLAKADLEAVAGKSLLRLRVSIGLAQVAAWEGDDRAALARVSAAAAIDRGWTEVRLVPVMQGFFRDPAYAAAGVRFLDGLEAVYPDTWWVFENRARLLRKLGRTAEAEAQHARARQLRGGA